MQAIIFIPTCTGLELAAFVNHFSLATSTCNRLTMNGSGFPVAEFVQAPALVVRRGSWYQQGLATMDLPVSSGQMLVGHLTTAPTFLICQPMQLEPSISVRKAGCRCRFRFFGSVKRPICICTGAHQPGRDKHNTRLSSGTGLRGAKSETG